MNKIEKWLSERVYWVPCDLDWESGFAWYLPKNVSHRRQVKIKDIDGFRLVWLGSCPEIYNPLVHNLYGTEEELMEAYRMKVLGDFQTAYRDLEQLDS